MKTLDAVANSSLFRAGVTLLVILTSAVNGSTQEVRLVVSAKAGERLVSKSSLHFEPRNPQNAATFTIDSTTQLQTIAGFGASILESGLICINSLPPDRQEQVLEQLFDPAKGAGFSAMKSPLAGTDFMSAGPWYTYDDYPGDVTMEHFSIDRDLGANGLVTFIKRARRYGNFVIQSPMDYPPDWMLVDVNHNQNVDPRYFDALALYYLRYLQGYEKQGIVIDYLSLFNEPGVYTKIPYASICELLKNHVGPLLRKEGVKTRLMLSEAPSRDTALKEYPKVMDDPDARQYVAVMPYHGYDLDAHGKIAQLHSRYPQVPIWMTEICHAYEAGTPKTMTLPRTDFDDGEFWGRQIFGDLEAGASAWIYWNLVLDQKGGPWAVSPIHGNPDPNAQHPVVIINRETGQVIYTGCYYYLAHFSKFVRPGAIRLKTDGNADDIRFLAFQTPEKSWVCQFMNLRPTAADVTVGWNDRSLRLTLPAHSMSTCLW